MELLSGSKIPFKIVAEYTMQAVDEFVDDPRFVCTSSLLQAFEPGRQKQMQLQLCRSIVSRKVPRTSPDGGIPLSAVAPSDLAVAFFLSLASPASANLISHVHHCRRH